MPGALKQTAIIIEDDKDICILLSILLQNSGIEVIKVHSLRMANSLEVTANVKIIFVDQRLPDGNGFEYIPIIKENYPNVPIVAMSAQNTVTSKAFFTQNRNTYYLEKPFRVDKLKELIKKIL